jgi:hypothetical protein
MTLPLRMNLVNPVTPKGNTIMMQQQLDLLEYYESKEFLIPDEDAEYAELLRMYSEYMQSLYK